MRITIPVTKSFLDILQFKPNTSTLMYSWKCEAVYQNTFSGELSKKNIWNNPSRILMLYGTNWGKVFKNGPSNICGRQPLKNLKSYCLPKHHSASVNIIYCATCGILISHLLVDLSVGLDLKEQRNCSRKLFLCLP